MRRCPRPPQAASAVQPGEEANHPELRRLTRTWIDALAPSIGLGRPAAGRPGLPLQVPGHPGQRYEVQASSDLVTWVTLDQRVAEIAPYAVTDPASTAAPAARYYRVLWQPRPAEAITTGHREAR